jgi:hypothetical protein
MIAAILAASSILDDGTSPVVFLHGTFRGVCASDKS